MSGSVPTTGGRFVLPQQQLLDPTGVPYNGAQLFSFVTGTGTYQATYSNAALTVPNPQPVLTNAAGFWPPIFLISAPAYRIMIQDPSGATLMDNDPCSPVPAQGSFSGTPGLTPVGMIAPFAFPGAPTGWLLCAGQAVSRAIYAQLFSVIGGYFGSGDGATTFNVPDLRGRYPLGQDNMGGVAANRVTYGGSRMDAATFASVGGDQMSQVHQHPITDVEHEHLDSGHYHYLRPDQGALIAYPTAGNELAASAGNFGINFAQYTYTSPGYASIGANWTGINHTENAQIGGSQNIPPSLTLSYCIFAGA